MSLQITQRREHEVPMPGRTGKVNAELAKVKEEMQKLGTGMVLEIEIGSDRTVRGTKALVTRAARELGGTWRHWHAGSKVFAQPMRKKPGRKPRARA